MLHTYRKTATIQAEQFDGSKEQVKRYPIIALGTLQDGCVYTGCPCVLKTKEGGMNLKKGDWIATGVDGEHWVIAVDYKAINFKADLKNAKRTAGDTVIQLSAKGKDVDMNLLGEIMDANGGVKVTIESNQTELVKDKNEADGQTELLGEDD